MRLIIVDDDLQTVEVIRDSINWTVFGIHEVEIAYNVWGAKKLFEEKEPHIVICDIEMPKGSGLDLLKWVRENEYKSEFIFLTCHESFEFASIALNYNASSYITKPFNIEKTEIAISKAVEKIRKENYFKEYSEYGQYWIQNKKLMIEGFWKELLFFSIPAEITLISEEISKRKLSLNVNAYYSLVLLSVFKSEIEGRILDDQTFEYALRKLSSEVILGELHFENVIHYVTNRNHYVVIIVPDKLSDEQLRCNCLSLIEMCEKYLKCSTTCYVGNKVLMHFLAQARVELEEMDQGNIASKSKVLIQGEDSITNNNNKYTIDTELISELLENGEKIKIVNKFKGELEGLTVENKLDAYLMYSIHQDFMQALYAFLDKKAIQAHKLFSDKMSQKMHSNADNSIFDMLKWVSFATNKTIDYVKEVAKTETIIDKAKQYIQEHYKEDISRNEVSSVFYLTPEYLAKMFKAETGITIKDYLNNCRIEKAKELLRNNNDSISMIAAEVGFDNFSYFSTLFKKSTGLGPQSYRKGFSK